MTWWLLHPTTLLVLFVAVTACTPGTPEEFADADRDAPVVSGHDGTVGSPTPSVDEGSVLDLHDPVVADAPSVVARSGAAARFIECAGDLANGGWGPDFGPPGPASDPSAGLRAFVDGVFAIPTSGYTEQGRSEHRVLYTYTVEDVPRVAVIIAHTDADAELATDGQGWVVETFATCDPSEFHPDADDELPQQVWTDEEGRRVPTSTVTSFRGAAHCNWETVTFLSLNGRQYVRDPDGAFGRPTVDGYDPSATLPTDATDTGYRRGRDELWLSADERMAYLVRPDHTEAWPSAVEQAGCA